MTARADYGALRYLTAMANLYRSKQPRKIYLEEWIEHLGISQAELARRIETNPENINRWISTPQRLNLDALSDLAAGLGLQSIGELFEPPPIAIAKRHFFEASNELLKTFPNQLASSGS